VLLGLAAALALPSIARSLGRAGLLAEALAWPSLLMLVLMALVFPFAGVASRTAYRFATSPVPTLDGLAFLDTASYTISPAYLGLPDGSFAPTPIELRYDADAIRWLNGHVAGTPVVLQSSAEFYRLYGVRIAANTGLPTVVSPLHEAEQRDPTSVYDRDRDVQRFYRSADPNELLSIVAQYHIGYVYVGAVERLIYGETGAATMAGMARSAGPLTVAYRNPQVTIYKVEPSAYDTVRIAPVSQKPTNASDDVGLRALEQRAAAEPGNLDLAWQLALRYAERGRFNDAVNAIQPLAEQRPNDVGVQQFYGDLLNRAGQIDAAEAAYRRAVQAEPSAANYTKLGSELVVWGRLDAAEEALAQAISSDPTLADPQFYLGQIAEERGQNERAALYYRRCLELSKPTDLLYMDAAAALRRLGK
jgi:tetratricopeptide (TPR) repeat protein